MWIYKSPFFHCQFYTNGGCVSIPENLSGKIKNFFFILSSTEWLVFMMPPHKQRLMLNEVSSFVCSVIFFFIFILSSFVIPQSIRISILTKQKFFFAANLQFLNCYIFQVKWLQHSYPHVYVYRIVVSFSASVPETNEQLRQKKIHCNELTILQIFQVLPSYLPFKNRDNDNYCSMFMISIGNTKSTKNADNPTWRQFFWAFSPLFRFFSLTIYSILHFKLNLHESKIANKNLPQLQLKDTQTRTRAHIHNIGTFKIIFFCFIP